MRSLLLALVVAVGAGCASTPRPAPWSVQGATASEERQALAIAEAAKRVLPGTPLEYGGRIVLASEVATRCYGPFAVGEPIAGCVFQGGVYVLWPHPRNPGCFDLAGCSALAHELCHVADWHMTEDQADACGLLVVLEYRKGAP